MPIKALKTIKQLAEKINSQYSSPEVIWDCAKLIMDETDRALADANEMLTDIQKFLDETNQLLKKVIDDE